MAVGRGKFRFQLQLQIWRAKTDRMFWIGEKMCFDKESSTKIKGIAIILMLFHHLFRSSDLYSGYTINWFPLLESQVVSLADMSKICVALFAIISGYGLTLKIKKAFDKKIIIRQVKGMVYRFILLFIPVLVIGQIINHRPENFYFSDHSFIEGSIYLIFDLLGISNLFGLSPYYGAYWYISAAIVFIVLLPLIYWGLQKIGNFWTLAVIILIPRILGVGYTGGNSAYPFLFAFALGCVLAENDYMIKILSWKPLKEKKKSLNAFLYLIIGLILLLMCYYIYKSIPVEKFWEINWGIIPLIFLCFCARFIINIPIVDKVLSVLGKYSMNIYILHVLFISYAKTYIYSTGYFLFALASLILISLIVSVILEKIENIIISYAGKGYLRIRRLQ